MISFLCQIVSDQLQNIFFVIDGTVVTPSLNGGILPGITRAGVVSLLKREGLEVIERAFTPEEAASAKEVFTTSSGAIVAPVVAIDGKPVGDGKPGGGDPARHGEWHQSRRGAGQRRDSPGPLNARRVLTGRASAPGRG